MRRTSDDELAGSDDRRPSTRSDMADGIDQLSRRLSGALVIAGGLIAFGVYSASGGGSEAPKYQAFAAGGEVFRLNTESGTIIACNSVRCTIILERGQDLAEGQGNSLFKLPAPPAQPAAQLPAPAQPAAQLPAPGPAQPGAAAPGPAQAGAAAPGPAQPTQTPQQQQPR